VSSKLHAAVLVPRRGNQKQRAKRLERSGEENRALEQEPPAVAGGYFMSRLAHEQPARLVQDGVPVVPRSRESRPQT